MYELIDKVKEINPLVVHYTNEVTINDCANVTLALGASPLMSYSYEDVVRGGKGNMSIIRFVRGTQE